MKGSTAAVGGEQEATVKIIQGLITNIRRKINEKLFPTDSSGLGKLGCSGST